MSLLHVFGQGVHVYTDELCIHGEGKLAISTRKEIYRGLQYYENISCCNFRIIS